ncbi:MAG: sensor histidine kinase [Acidobacteriota bacterium]
MPTYSQMTKAELIQTIQRLEAREGLHGSSAEPVDPERERLLQELQVHQAELETQNEDLRRMQQLLEESRDRYADLYDFAPVGYLTLDDRGVIQEINLTGAALLGAVRTRVIGKSFSRYVAPAEIPALRDHLRRAFQQPEPLTAILHLNVTTLPLPVVQLVSLARKDAKTGALLIRTTMTDITERQAAEERIRALNQDLARRSAESEAAHHELEALVYSVSHDLHVPIAQIEQLGDLLYRNPTQQLSAEDRDLVDLIRANAQEANRLADALLVLARIDQRVPHKQTVAMRELARQALEELQAEQSGRQVEITLGDLPAAEADPGLMKQVWVNLLSNALKFTRLQETTRIEIGARAQDGHTVYFVKDNGAGFDMADADRLFRVFQRLHHAEDFPGNGLGLAVVDRIVRRHAGRVWAEAKVGQGAMFSFTLA